MAHEPDFHTPSGFLDYLIGAFGASLNAIGEDASGNNREIVTRDDVDALLASGPDCYLFPAAAGQVRFLYHHSYGAGPDWRLDPFPATYVLANDAGAVIRIWSLQEPVALTDALPVALAYGTDLGQPVPVPGCNDWRTVAFDSNFCDLAQLAEDAPTLAPYLRGEPVFDADGLPVFGWLADGVVRRPFDLGVPELRLPVSYMFGRSATEKRWVLRSSTILEATEIAMTHKVGGKDGFAWSFTEMPDGGARDQTSVTGFTAVFLDLDYVENVPDLERRLMAQPYYTAVHTTHSHMTATTEKTRDTVVMAVRRSKSPAVRADEALQHDETLRAYLRESTIWPESIIAGTTFERVSRPNGRQVVFHHPPIQKARVIAFMAKPWLVADHGNTDREGRDAWKSIPAALAKALDVPFDRSGLDANRLIYMGRHAEGAPFHCALFPGPLLDPDRDLAGVTDAVGRPSKADLSNGARALMPLAAKYGAGWEFASIYRDFASGLIRQNYGDKVVISCPNDDAHSNAGDESDRACIATDTGVHAGTITCRHSSCVGLDRLEMITLATARGDFEESALSDTRYCAVQVGEVQSPAATAQHPGGAPPDATLMPADELDAAIDAVGKDPSAKKLEPVLSRIAEIDDRLARNIAVKRLSRISKVAVGELRDAIRSERRRKRKIDTAPKDADGRLLHQYEGDYDVVDAGLMVGSVITALNKDAEGKAYPFLTSAMDQLTVLNETGKRAQFAPVERAKFDSIINSHMKFQQTGDEYEGPRKHVAPDVLAYQYQMASVGLAPTPEALGAPVFLRDGTLAAAFGYYPAHDIYRDPKGLRAEPIPSSPSEAEVDEALHDLRVETLGDFPFSDTQPDGSESRDASEANALAFVITPFVRRMINSCTPMFFINKPQPGTGGTFLGMVPMILAIGDVEAAIQYTPTNDEENRKAIVAAAREGRQFMFFDDVKDLNSRPVIQSITYPTVGGRLLGQSVTIERDNTMIWCGGGNNVYMGPEMDRRTCMIRLNAKSLDINKRTYRHPNYPVWLRSNRARLVRAILILAQNWIAGGKVPFTARTMASFEDWARVVGGILQAAGVKGFINNPRRAAVDPQQAASRLLVRDWLKRFGLEPVGARTLADWAIMDSQEIVSGKDEADQKKRLYRTFADLDGMIFEIEGKAYSVYSTVDNHGELQYSLRREDKKETGSVDDEAGNGK